MKEVCFILLVLFFCSSCKKDNFLFQLEGKMMDTTFNKGLEGAEVTLEEKLMAGQGNPETYTAIVDASGNYKLEFKRKKAVSYTLRIEKKNYFELYKEIPFSDFSTEEPLILNLSTTAKAWFNIIFVNTAPSTDFDKLTFIKQDGKTNCLECCPIEEQTVISGDTVIYSCINDGNTPYSYIYTSENPADYGWKQFITTAFDTTNFYHYW